MVNTNKIKGRMRELEITQSDVAKQLDISLSAVNQKLGGIRSFSLNEAERLAAILGIRPEEFGTYFFVN